MVDASNSSAGSEGFDLAAVEFTGPAAEEACAAPSPAGTFIRGDATGDRRLDLADPVAALFHLFAGEILPCREAIDANDDGLLDVSDPIAALRYLFTGGPAPAAPFPLCGLDPTADGLDCAEGCS